MNFDYDMVGNEQDFHFVKGIDDSEVSGSQRIEPTPKISGKK